MVELELSEQDKVWVVELDKIIYRNGELRRCYYKMEEYYLLRTYKNNMKELRAILIKRFNSDCIRHINVGDLYTDRDSCQKVVDGLNALQENKII